MSRIGDKRVRRMQDGQWYWASKPVVQKFAREIGFLALAVYHFLASMADKNQSCFPSQTRIAKCLGCSRSSVGRAIASLRANGLVSVEKSDSSNRYFLLSAESSTDEASGELSEAPDEPPKASGGAYRCDTNNLRISKSDTSVRHLLNQGKGKGEKVRQRGNEELLARDLAIALGEPDEYELYLSLTQSYPEPFLREMLSKVNQTPRHKIKKNRAAYFTYLVRLHGQKFFHHFGD